MTNPERTPDVAEGRRLLRAKIDDISFEAYSDLDDWLVSNLAGLFGEVGQLRIKHAKAQGACKRLRELGDSFQDMFFNASGKWLEVRAERDSIKRAARALLDALPRCYCAGRTSDLECLNKCATPEKSALEALL